MTETHVRFAELLTEAVHRIRIREGKTIAAIQDELGYAIGREGGSAIEYWRKGNLPSSRQDIEKMARVLVKRGQLELQWLERFLHSAQYAVPQALVDELFASPRTEYDSPTGPPSSIQRRAQTLFMAPPMPPQAIWGRSAALQKVWELLTSDGEIHSAPPVAINGMGGIGKTTLAAALCHHEEIPRTFPDGVLWATLGPNPSIRLLLEEWGRALGLNLGAEANEMAICNRLRSHLYPCKALLVVDDVWEPIHAQFFHVAGPRCRMLITTREAPIAYTMATRERSIHLDVLDEANALALLYRLAPDAVSADEKSARLLCQRLENHPLALTLAGRLLAAESDVPSRLRRLIAQLIDQGESRLHLMQSELRPGLREDRETSLRDILGMSIERLEPDDRARFAALSVFGGEPLSWAIPAAAHIWNCSIEEAERSISRMIQRGLVMRRGEQYWMHALFADYARMLAKRPQAVRVEQSASVGIEAHLS